MQHLRKIIIAMSALLSIVLFVPESGAPDALAAKEESHVWTFDADKRETLPSGFAVGTLFDGRPAGDWKIVQTEKAKSPPHVLGQLMGKGAEHAYKVILVKDVTAMDLDLQVSFMPISGKGDMGGGLIWRAAGDRDYYLTRANPLEQNIRIYHVVKGVRRMIQNSDKTIEAGKWHVLRLVARGCRAQVFYDEQPIFDLCDETFKSGNIGLWTKSDAVTYFDDLKFQVLK